MREIVRARSDKKYGEIVVREKWWEKCNNKVRESNEISSERKREWEKYNKEVQRITTYVKKSKTQRSKFLKVIINSFIYFYSLRSYLTWEAHQTKKLIWELPSD